MLNLSNVFLLIGLKRPSPRRVEVDEQATPADAPGPRPAAAAEDS